ncbi:hypothetical protein [Thermodesulfatator atlanticus]|uniref:hypothetical protein n=1 Tax=Thermodesulfatator atlanticus TaxID=501497 RepID=UPI00040B6A0D|nr:hypothetical protein [Thermodesulfatator atlanticus]
MQRIPIEMAKAGMILAKDVTDEAGRVLCGPETELTTELIEKFKAMGVKFVSVKGHPIDFPWERPYEEEIKLLEARFAKVADDPRLISLKKIIADYLKEKNA